MSTLPIRHHSHTYRIGSRRARLAVWFMGLMSHLRSSRWLHPVAYAHRRAQDATLPFYYDAFATNDPAETRAQQEEARHLERRVFWSTLLLGPHLPKLVLPPVDLWMWLHCDHRGQMEVHLDNAYYLARAERYRRDVRMAELVWGQRACPACHGLLVYYGLENGWQCPHDAAAWHAEKEEDYLLACAERAHQDEMALFYAHERA